LADNPEIPPPAPIGQAIQDVTEKASLLIREEIELAKAEVESKVKSLLVGSVVGIAAGVFVAIGMFFVLNGLAWLAWYELFPSGQFFWGFFMVAAGLFVTAGLAGFLATKAFKSSAPPVPYMAIEEAQLIRQTITSSDPDPETKT
jgi:hypothetical protein